MVRARLSPSKKKITVSNSAAPVEDDFLGFNTVQHCFTYIKDNQGRNYTDEQAQLEFNRLQNMGVKMVRTYYNNEFAYNTTTGEFNWESDNMQDVYKWMQEMQKRDISVAINTGWSMRGAYIKNYYAPWLGCYVEGNLEATAKNQANFIRDSLNQFRAHGINNIDYLIMFTEPGGVAADTDVDWSQLKNYYLEDAYDFDPNVERWLTCSRAIHNALVENGTRALYKTVGPNCAQSNVSKDPDTRMSPLYYFALKYASDYIDIYSAHRYPNIEKMFNDSVSNQLDAFKTDERILGAKNLGKKFWYDETGLSGGGTGYNNVFAYDENNLPYADNPSLGLHATSYFADSMNRGVQNLMWWYIMDQQWPNNNTNNTDCFYNGMHCCGVVPSLLRSDVPETSYYAISLLTKYFGNNAKVYKTGSPRDGAVLDTTTFAGKKTIKLDSNTLRASLPLNLKANTNYKLTFSYYTDAVISTELGGEAVTHAILDTGIFIPNHPVLEGIPGSRLGLSYTMSYLNNYGVNYQMNTPAGRLWEVDENGEPKKNWLGQTLFVDQDGDGKRDGDVRTYNYNVEGFHNIEAGEWNTLSFEFNSANFEDIAFTIKKIAGANMWLSDIKLESVSGETEYFSNSGSWLVNDVSSQNIGNNEGAVNYTVNNNVGVQQDKNGDWSICLANFEDAPTYIEINFDKNIGNKKFYRHVYYEQGTVPTSEAKIIPADKSVVTYGDVLKDKIPANCTVVYTTIKD
ncbi:MAG: hypothetical protein E7551_08925 [Ruminococcaceae bacterium]|nr:hypothetical protein [Oscillospiraceae bacterium]